jgi:hypothetical protein
VNLPYIAWVAAFNTTILLSYLLLDLAFFPTPLAKSTYSPVSGLKVVRQPSSRSVVSPTRAVPFPPSVPPGSPTTPTQGPCPMPPPVLLDAINRNSLAVFLIVRFPSPPFLLVYVYADDLAWNGMAGERGDRGSEPVDADDVRVRWTCNGGASRVRVRCVCVRVGNARSAGVEVVEL